MTESILKLVIFFAVGIGMAIVPVALSFLLWYHKNRADNKKKIIGNTSKEYEPYESGMPPKGSGRRVGFEYFIYAILFLVFDIIVILAFLGVIALRHNKADFIFPFIILLGLSLLIIAYGVKKRDYIKL